LERSAVALSAFYDTVLLTPTRLLCPILVAFRRR
jgi:hypothetical protein